MSDHHRLAWPFFNMARPPLPPQYIAPTPVPQQPHHLVGAMVQHRTLGVFAKVETVTSGMYSGGIAECLLASGRRVTWPVDVLDRVEAWR